MNADMSYYTISAVPDYGVVRESCGAWVRVWARWILRVRSGGRYVCTAYESLPSLRRHVRSLRFFGFVRQEGGGS